MRVLIWITVIAAALWSGLWFVASTSIRNGTESWFAEQAAQGITAEKSALVVQGFPSRVDVTVSDLVLADPAQGTGWQTPFLQVFSMSWKPWHLIAALPTGQVVTLPGQEIALDGEGMLASLELHPGISLALDKTRFEAKALRLISTAGWSFGAEQVFAATEEDPSLVNTHRLGLKLQGITPDPVIAGAAGLPARADLFHLDAYASFTAPIDRHAGQAKPRLSVLDLREARLDWGNLQITAGGRMAAGADGLAEGEIEVKITGWRQLLPLMVAMGRTTADQARVLERGLEVLAKAGGDPNVLNLTLRAAGGQMVLGPLPLGPAPRMN